MEEAPSLVSSRAKEVIPLLASCRDAMTPTDMDTIKLVVKLGAGISQENLDKAADLHDIYNLLERKTGCSSAALNIVVQMLERLDVDQQIVEALKEHVNQDEIIDQKMDFILTISCVFCQLGQGQYNSFKNMAIEVLSTRHKSSTITSRVHLLQLLLEQNCISPTSFPHLFAWLKLIGCQIYHKKLKEYCTRHNLSEPEWEHLIPLLKKNFGSPIPCSDSDLSYSDATSRGSGGSGHSQTYQKQLTPFSDSGGDNVPCDEATKTSHREPEPIAKRPQKKSQNIIPPPPENTVKSLNNGPQTDERRHLINKKKTTLWEKMKRSWICRCCIFFLVLIVALVGAAATVLGIHFFGQSNSTGTNRTQNVSYTVPLGENATMLINHYDPSNISHIVFTVPEDTQTLITFYAAPCSSVRATNTSFPDRRNTRVGSGEYISLNYYSLGYYFPVYTADKGALLFYFINFTQIPNFSSCFHAYLYNYSNFDAYTDALSNQNKPSRFVQEILHCPTSTNEVFVFTFVLDSDGFYYIAAYLPVGMTIDAKISAEIPTYNRTYLDTLPSLLSCQLDGDTCLLEIRNNNEINFSGHHHLCLLASSSSDTHGEVINGTVTIYYY
ncbi:PREDICTED: uncharacterized protein LOC109583142 [Amphimedon queenslandica]|uniref:Uncharacterized protein n=1 Tax=Amphimedon queenslandica TaxID=400682 RepID=A0A1X7UIJ6_AMPQE|nr:PREDICTED: uncharacterized protein LOC109583142 [Amphimedon queenslandica]|eukprot:XP_019853912.1 PREDICTED: uncharacterized protein LOC109583142 [Amphimedon queenslandica]